MMRKGELSASADNTATDTSPRKRPQHRARSSAYTDEPANVGDVPRSIAYVDGPNMLGVQRGIQGGRRPRENERPRWDRVKPVLRHQYRVEEAWYFLNGDNFDFPQVWALRRALRNQGWLVATPRSDDGFDDVDPVDGAIKAAINAAVPRVRDGLVKRIVVLSHDHGYAPALRQVLEAGGSVCVVGFVEEISPALLGLRRAGAEIVDFETNLGAFDIRLPRPRIPSFVPPHGTWTAAMGDDTPFNGIRFPREPSTDVLRGGSSSPAPKS